MTDRVGQQFGNYRLTHLLGRGGFAEVYLAEHRQLGMKAAIKILHASLPNDEMRAFRQEARAIADLKHPHIIRVLDFDVQNGTPFLVLDYAAKGSLRQLHPRGSKLPLDLVVTYAQQIASALQYAHDHKLIHRDVKPENVLIGEDGQLLLSDFGIATIAHSTSSMRTEASMGTLAYMAPEQIQGKPRPASDQYALAVMVYQWLTGTLPFVGSSVELIAQHLGAPPPPLRASVPDLPVEVEQVVVAALAKDPQQRFQTVKAFANALAHTLDDNHTFIDTKRTRNKIPPDQNNVSTYVKPPLPASPAWTPPPGTPTGGTYPPPKPPDSRPKRASGFVMTSITLGILLVVSSIVGVAYLLAHTSGNPGGTANTGSPTTQATLTSTPGSTNGLSYPHLSSSYSGTAYDTTYNKSANLSFSISQNQQAISGTAKVSANGLMDSGNFTGTVGTDDTLQFTVTFFSGGVSKFVGTISSQKTLSGTYTTTYPNGISPNHQGTWEVSPNSV